MFVEHHEEQQLYHSIATVGTLLLQIGDVGKQFYIQRAHPTHTDSTASTPEGSINVSAMTDSGMAADSVSEGASSHPIPVSASLQSVASEATSVTSSHLPDQDWSITFEQVLASMLTETPLVDFFEHNTDLRTSIEKYRNRRLLERSASISSSPNLK